MGNGICLLRESAGCTRTLRETKALHSNFGTCMRVFLGDIMTTQVSLLECGQFPQVYHCPLVMYSVKSTLGSYQILLTAYFQYSYTSGKC